MNSKSYFSRSIALIFAILSFCFSNAQWTSNGPYGGTAYALLDNGTALFAGTRNSVFISADNGASWQAASSGIEKIPVFDLASDNTDIYAATDGSGVFLSTNNGSSWTNKSTGLLHKTVYSLIHTDHGMYAGTNGGVYFSSNGGDQWAMATAGIPQGYQVRNWAVMGDTVYAGTYGVGMYSSHDKGQTWQKTGNGFPDSQITIYVYDMLVKGDTMLVSTNHGIYRSTDRGLSWSSIGTGLPQGSHIFALAEKPGLLAGAVPHQGIYISTDNGATWSSSNSGLKQWSLTPSVFVKYAWFTDLTVSGQNFVAASEEGIFLSADNAASWDYSDNGVTALFTSGVTTSQGMVFAGTGESGVYVSSDKGASWQRSNNGIPDPSIFDVAANSAYAFASVINYNVYRSSDNGSSWQPAHTNLPHAPFDLEANEVRVTALVGNTPSQPVKLFHSLNNGASWVQIPATVPGISAVGLLNQKIYIGTDDGMLLWTDDEGTTWHDISGYMPDVRISTILALDSVVYVGTSGQGIYRFTNDGDNMQTAGFGLGSMWINDIIQVNGVLFSSSSAGVYASTNGLSWFAVNEGLDDLNTWDLAHFADQIFVGTSTGVYQTSEDEEFFNRVMILAGIPRNESAVNTAIFPNPCDGILYYNAPGEVEIQIYNVQGQLINSEKGKNSGNLDLRDQPSGIYVIKMLESQKSTVKKIVVR